MEIKTCKQMDKQGHHLIGPQHWHMEEERYKSLLPVIDQYVC